MDQIAEIMNHIIPILSAGIGIVLVSLMAAAMFIVTLAITFWPVTLGLLVVYFGLKRLSE